jgi:hypothetical protein
MKRFDIATCLSQLVLVTILVGYSTSLLQLVSVG